ncbi:MAG: RsbRD N-terminal domain-containing protein [Desulfobacterales bacterium]
MNKNPGEEIISANRNRWISQWFDAVINSYPEESAGFFKDTSDPFSNPVGATLKKGIKDLFDVVTAGNFDSRAAHEALEPMIRLRALQEFTPSEALGFITDIKWIIRGDSAADQNNQAVAERLDRIAEAADRALLTAFDIYMECKKHVYDLRARQARDSVRELLVKKELISELPDIDREPAK